MMTLVLALIAAIVVHYLFGGIRLQARGDKVSGAAQVQFSVLLGLFVLFKAVDYWLDRFDLTTDQGRRFTGINYTAVQRGAAVEEHPHVHRAHLRAAVLRQRLPPHLAAALGRARAAGALGDPARRAVAGDRVAVPGPARPSRTRRRTFLARNIEATREAFDIADVERAAVRRHGVGDRGPAAGERRRRCPASG